MIYDVAIIGAGASGASVAWQLSHYDVKAILLESAVDVCFGVSKSNSGIIHGGFHHGSDTLKARLELRGNAMFDALKADLDFPFRRDGVLVVAFNEDDMPAVKRLYEQGVANGVPGIELCSRGRMLALEPKLNQSVVGGLFAPNGGTIEPYRYVFALVESAVHNGIEVMCNWKVTSGSFDGDHWHIKNPEGGEIEARYVVNAAGLFADEVSRCCGAEEFCIIPRKGEEYLLDRNSAGRPSRVVFPAPSKHSKGVLVIPTVEGTTMIGPTADSVYDKTDTATTREHQKRIVAMVQNMVNGISPRDIIASFAGLRPVLDTEDFYIDLSEKVPALVQVAGIQSPGLTASPAIGEYVRDLLVKAGLVLLPKTDYEAKLSPHHCARTESLESLQKLYAENPAWTNIVCRCEKISEAEIVDAVRKGHTTVDGVKFYTRAGMGRCQGGFCSAKIMKIISRESGIPMTELTKRGGGSRILMGHLGDLEFSDKEQEG